MPDVTEPLPAALVEGLVHDTAALSGDRALRDVVAAHERAAAAPYGAVLGPLVVAASQAEELRTLAAPDGLLLVALVADQGLLALQEARHALQDDAWLVLDHVRIPLPPGVPAAEAARALLAELAFTVPSFVELPRTGYENALDVLAEDGVEPAAYRCGATDGGTPPGPGELAAFVHACVDRGVAFAVPDGLDHALRGPGPAGEHLGSLNVLAAVAAARSGATTSEVADVLEVADAAAVLDVVRGVPALALRATFRGLGTPDVTAALGELVGAGAVHPGLA